MVFINLQGALHVFYSFNGSCFRATFGRKLAK